MRTATPVLLIALVPLVGCYSVHDGGSVPPRDGGAAVDSGAVGRDGGPIGRDAGPPPDCRTEVVDPHPGAGACSPAVSDCIARCPSEDGSCPGMCIGSEPECQRCFFQTLISCANELGCSDAWHTFACCTASVPICSGATGVDRIQCAGSCMTEIDAYSTCLNERGAMRCYFEAATGCDVRLGG